MDALSLSSEAKAVLVEKLKRYLHEELDQEIGQFDAEFLLEFLSKELGGYHYNKGLKDAQDLFTQRMETVVDGIYELEIPTAY